MKKRRRRPILTGALALTSVIVVLGFVEALSLLANLLSPPPLDFCLWCRQSVLARQAGAARVGPHGLAPPEPPAAIPDGRPRGPRHNPELLKFRKVEPDFIRQREPYFALKPGVYRAWSETKTGEKVFDVPYTIDQFGRRVVPRQGESSRKRFLMVLGCSRTFGDGIEDDETLPYQISRSAPGYRVYNYGVGGYAPSDLVLRLRDTDLAAEISEKEGIAAYLYIDDHLARVVGSMSMMSWGAEKPYIAEDQNGKLQYRGSFAQALPLSAWLYRGLIHSQFIQRFSVELPLWISDANLERFTRLIAEMRDLIKSKKALRKFYVVFYPETDGDRLLIPFLERHGIDYLNYASWRRASLSPEQHYLSYDGHPSPANNRALAKYFSRDLGVGAR